MKLVIRGSRKYITWLGGHLHREHPKTRGHTAYRGQGTIIGLVMTIITLFAFYALAPTLTSTINTGVNQSNMTGSDALLSYAFPTFILLGILISWLAFLLPSRQQNV